MKNINENLKNDINQEVLNLVKCCKIITQTNEKFGFSTASEKFIYEELEYSSLSIEDISSIKTGLDIKEDTVEVSCIVSHENNFTNNLLSSKFDNAKIDIFLLNLANMNNGQISLITGKISLIKLENSLIKLQIKGLKNEFNRTIGNIYSPLCRVSFCDNKCRLNTSDYLLNGKVSKIENNKNIYTENENIKNKPVGYFENGILTFTSGKNKDYKIEIESFENKILVLSTEMSFSIEIGDEFTLIAGCNKQFSTCCDKFNNAINFRGEPHVPGINLLLRVK